VGGAPHVNVDNLPTLSREGKVYLLWLGEGQNRLNLDWIAAVEAHLGEVEASPAPRALVTSASGNCWSTGIDLDWIAANSEKTQDFLERLHALFARVLALGVPTVAALQGHTFAAGAMLALAHDQRVMREDRGYFCLPEIDLSLPFTPAMTELIRARLNPQVAHEAMTTGRRYGGAEALARGIVDQLADQAGLAARASELAGTLADKDPATLAAIKQRLYAGVLAQLRDPVATRPG
jgi:enoyl-CoA hydratase/carnithine racemase